nr:MAG TPA: hypothetical protein [Caudoviricetes sp.]DAN61024.1 MAG TPA: hypothetical protein [Caudoviricetes sp.]DAQ06378.1 MAG TPA: hypothetical protein [Caudoviricetes sp.]DAZ67774.1 MAG TPA: hypothetical protein [Caudoviricetes sp.]DAZ68181.1 MAG TPA: hypothetical protein [Caudoviricetes sp.]
MEGSETRRMNRQIIISPTSAEHLTIKLKVMI